MSEQEEMYEEIQEDSKNANGLLYNVIYEAGEKFAGTYLGQYTTGKVDKLLKLFEDTAKWSLPQDNIKNECREPLERPLPWIPFIALIVVLRFIRISLSITWFFIGNAPILPKDMVYFIQTRRRKLRAIRITGMRYIRKKEQALGKNTGFISKLRSLLSTAICKPGKHALTMEHKNTFDGTTYNMDNETEFKQKPLSHKRKTPDESCSDQDLTLDQIIDKYGNVSSDDDSDFKPPENVSNKESSLSDSSSLTTSDDNDGDESVKKGKNICLLESDVSRDIETNQSVPEVIDVHHEQIPNTDQIQIKENGHRAEKLSSKPVPMPKPYKHAPVPVPIHEIKQETKESEEEGGVSTQRDTEKNSLCKQMDPVQKSFVAYDDKSIKTYDKMQDQCFKTNQMEHLNRGRSLPIDQSSEEVFLTPATSTEDVFFSPVGSPNINSNFGFQPTSTFENPGNVCLENIMPEILCQEHTSTPEVQYQDSIKVESTTQQHLRGGSCQGGKSNKNKSRGRKR